MKQPLLALPFLFIFPAVIAQVAGPQSGRSFSNTTLSGAEKSWGNTENVAASDNQYADFGDLSDVTGSHTDYLVVTGFRFSIPPASGITGIIVYIEGDDPNSVTADFSIRIVKEGTVCGTEHSANALYPDLGNKDSYRTYGSSSDLWGETWTPADIISDNFGVAVAAQRGVTGNEAAGRIDNIRIAVYYTVLTTLPVKLTKFSAALHHDKVRLTWTTAEESGMDRFELQRSSNATGFSSFGTVICSNRQASVNYTFTDYTPLEGTSYYRLKMLENDRKITYSKIVSIDVEAGNTATLYPNPWKKGAALSIRNPGNEKLTIRFYSHTGELLAKLSTSGDEVPAAFLPTTTGMLRYKVHNEKNEITGSGTLMIY